MFQPKYKKNTFKIPKITFIELEEAKYYFPEEGQNADTVDLTDKDLYYGQFYAKLATTVNRIKQYNHMVFGDPHGIVHRRAQL